MLESLASMYVSGADVDWESYDRPYARRKTTGPSYPFARESYWLKPQRPASSNVDVPQKPHALLKHKTQDDDAAIVFETEFTAALSVLDDHRLFEIIIVPGANHLSMIMAAALMIDPAAPPDLREIYFPQAMALGNDETRSVVLKLQRPLPGQYTLELLSTVKGEEDWITHAVGNLDGANSPASPAPLHPDEIRARCPNEMSAQEFFGPLWGAGYHLGPAYRWLEHIWRGEKESLCRLRLRKNSKTISIRIPA